jgi:hypothetical protein
MMRPYIIYAETDNIVVSSGCCEERFFADMLQQFPGCLIAEGVAEAGTVYDPVTKTSSPSAKPIEALRMEAKTRISLRRDAAMSDNVLCHGRQWQADANSVDLLNKAISLAGAGLPLPTVWRDADNGNMLINNIDDLLAIAAAIQIQVQEAYAKSWALKEQVSAATTKEELDAIVW